MKVYLGSDHRGYKLKEKVFAWLVEKDYLVEDLGAYELLPDDDFTEYAEKVASVVGEHYAKIEREEHELHGKIVGILFCGSGVGADIAANKFDGVRASLGKEVNQVKAGRSDDDMNILVIAADFTNTEDAKKMITTFLSTDFKGEERHLRRLEDIKRIEENN